MVAIDQRRSYRLVPALLLVGAGLTAASDGVAGEPDAAAGRGASAWAQVCQRCHNLRDPTEFRDDQLRAIVSHMRVRGGLYGQQARDILAFLQASNGGAWNGTTSAAWASPATAPTAVKADPAAGRAIYERTCVACHGKDGRGALPGVPGLALRDGPLSKADEVLRTNILQGIVRSGAPMAMPPRGGDPNLTEADADAVLAYLRATFGGGL